MVVSDRISPVFAVPLLHVVALVLPLASPNVQCSWRTGRRIESLESPDVGFDVYAPSIVPRSSRSRTDGDLGQWRMLVDERLQRLVVALEQ